MDRGELVYEGPHGQPTTVELDDDNVWYDPDIDHWVIARQWSDRGGNTPVTYVPVRRVFSVTVNYNVLQGDRVPTPPEELAQPE